MLSDPQIHYLDNAATTRVDPAVTEVIHDALVELWANPSSLYDPAVAAQDGIETARARIAKTLHCRSDEIYFTACGSESNNMAIYGAALRVSFCADNTPEDVDALLDGLRAGLRELQHI